MRSEHFGIPLSAFSADRTKKYVAVSLQVRDKYIWALKIQNSLILKTQKYYLYIHYKCP